MGALVAVMERATNSNPVVVPPPGIEPGRPKAQLLKLVAMPNSPTGAWGGMVPGVGLEPARMSWLRTRPLDHFALSPLVDPGGVEPPTSCLQGRCSPG